MGKDDDVLKVAFPHPQEIPVNPPPHLFFMTKDINVYNCMMKAVFEFYQVRAEAESKMYSKILACMSKGQG